mgnify:CR=1 FL=1
MQFETHIDTRLLSRVEHIVFQTYSIEIKADMRDLGLGHVNFPAGDPGARDYENSLPTAAE